MERAGRRFGIKKESEGKRLAGYGEVPQPMSELATPKNRTGSKGLTKGGIWEVREQAARRHWLGQSGLSYK